MAPSLNHPTGVAFVDDHDLRAANVDAATYYGGGESYTRSRTYSHVRLRLVFFAMALLKFLLVTYSWVQPEASACLSRGLAFATQTDVPRREERHRSASIPY